MRMRYLTAAGLTFLPPASAPTVNLEVAGYARVLSLFLSGSLAPLSSLKIRLL